MDAEASEEIALVGQRIRAMRTDAGLSLSQMAADIGVSTSLLSQVERGRVMPSMASLLAIAKYLHLTLYQLFQPRDDTPEGSLIHHAERRRVTFGEGGIIYELISADECHDFEFFEVILSEGGTNFEHAVRHEGYECVLVIEGNVSVRVGTVRHLLVEGDSLTYRATLEHELSRLESHRARVLVVACPPPHGGMS